MKPVIAQTAPGTGAAPPRPATGSPAPPPPPSTLQAIRASVVVPSKDRPDLLRACLEALLRQEPPSGAWEIIVVDDGRTGNGETVAAVVKAAGRAARRKGPEIRYVSNQGSPGPAAARNAGWRAARGEIVAFTDDDCLPAPRWLATGVAAFVDGVAGVSGRLILPLRGSPTDYQLDASHLAESEFVTANCFYRRSALQAAGGFDERFSLAWREDSDLYFTLLEQGRRLVREPGAVVVHPIREAPWGVSLLQQRKTTYNALLEAKHPELYRLMIGRSPASYYPLTLSLVGAAGLLGAGRPRAAAGAALVWLAGTLAFAGKRLRTTRRDPIHVAEMLATSAVIPPVSLFWRLYGRVKFARSAP